MSLRAVGLKIKPGFAFRNALMILMEIISPGTVCIVALITTMAILWITFVWELVLNHTLEIQHTGCVCCNALVLNHYLGNILTEHAR